MKQNQPLASKGSDLIVSKDEFADLGSTQMVKTFLDFLADEIEADPSKLVPYTQEMLDEDMAWLEEIKNG
jgi:hypothetical protein